MFRLVFGLAYYILEQVLELRGAALCRAALLVQHAGKSFHFVLERVRLMDCLPKSGGCLLRPVGIGIESGPAQRVTSAISFVQPSVRA